MKKVFLVLVAISFIVMTSVAYGAEKILLGNGNIALKMDYLQFTEGALEDLDNDECFYIGLEAYNKITSNLYVGMEIGYATSEGSADILFDDFGEVDADTELTFVPIELNLKYALDITPRLALDFGAGASYNWMKEEISARGRSSEEDDWLWGGQFFAALNYKIDRFFIGINGKYQLTEDFEIDDDETDVNANNWRIGGQVGIMF
jgi:Outer membrane protein beta-barrel domain